MRKAYFSKRNPVGKSRNETQWDPIPIERTVAFCGTDYMHEIFLEHLPPSGPILEAGCGLGYYVIYYQELGYQIYGLEWVSETLRRTKRYRPDAGVLGGDVQHLPFKNKTFKMVFSGGVLEHFELGPSQALREAHRILDDDGLLLVLVPFVNALRRLEDFFHLTLRRKTLKSTVGHDGREMIYHRVETVGMDGPPPEGYHFHGYYFTKSGLISILERSGFEVIKTHGVAIEAGLLEFPWFRALFERFWPGQRTGRLLPGRPSGAALLSPGFSAIQAFARSSRSFSSPKSPTARQQGSSFGSFGASSANTSSLSVGSSLEKTVSVRGVRGS